MPYQNDYDANSADAAPTTRVYEMSSTANQNLNASSPYTDDASEADAPLSGPGAVASSPCSPTASAATSHDSLLSEHDSRALAADLHAKYRDEDRSAEFDMREKEEVRGRERAEAEREMKDVMWWMWRATAGVAAYALGSVVVMRVWPAWIARGQ